MTDLNAVSEIIIDSLREFYYGHSNDRVKVAYNSKMTKIDLYDEEKTLQFRVEIIEVREVRKPTLTKVRKGKTMRIPASERLLSKWILTYLTDVVVWAASKEEWKVAEILEEKLSKREKAGIELSEEELRILRHAKNCFLSSKGSIHLVEKLFKVEDNYPEGHTEALHRGYPESKRSKENDDSI